ncbi:hypothetical protein [Clostridium botulinum]|uniref:hypothetical protein n=1 Tax=Clostridium botulinum TaxID=1491 RepID=UPI0019D39A08|nr:hypothetical protein [Clostridium botulinum]
MRPTNCGFDIRELVAEIISEAKKSQNDLATCLLGSTFDEFWSRVTSFCKFSRLTKFC